MIRVEKSVDEQGSQFSWFQAAASLEETIRQRTEQYEQLNLRLKGELESRREIELALKQAKEAADRANETKTRFLAAASHDLRQPLSSALLFLESIRESTLAGLDLDYLNKARVALASLSNLLDTLLDVARLDSGGIEPHYSGVSGERGTRPAGPRVRERGAFRRARAQVPAFERLGALRRVSARDGPAQSHQQCHPLLAARAGPGGLPAPARRAGDLGVRHGDRHREGASGGDFLGLLPGAFREAGALGGDRSGTFDRAANLETPFPGAPRPLGAGARLSVRCGSYPTAVRGAARARRRAVSPARRRGRASRSP